MSRFGQEKGERWRKLALVALWIVLVGAAQKAETRVTIQIGGAAVAHSMSFRRPKPGRTILVVDDYEAHRYALTRTLEHAGFAVLGASTGEEAVAQSAQHPSLILLDVGLPDLSGFDVCRKIKANPETAGIPVVFVSAVHMNQDSVMEGELAGGSSFLFFPVILEELLPVIEGSIAKAKNGTSA